MSGQKKRAVHSKSLFCTGGLQRLGTPPAKVFVFFYIYNIIVNKQTKNSIKAKKIIKKLIIKKTN